MCCWVSGFKGSAPCHLQIEWSCEDLLDCLILGDEAAWFFLSSGTTHPMTKCYIPEGCSPQPHCSDSVTSCNILFPWQALKSEVMSACRRICYISVNCSWLIGNIICSSYCHISQIEQFYWERFVLWLEPAVKLCSTRRLYRVSQEECARLWESVPYVKLYQYNPKHL